MAAAAETSVNGDIDGNDNDKGNAGAFGQLGITEATSGSGDGRKMAVEEAAVYRKALAASASSRALGSGLSRREWARRLVRLSLIHRHQHARAQAALVPRRRRLVCRLVGLSLVLLPLLARPRTALALRRPSAFRLIDLSLVRQPLRAWAHAALVPHRRRPACRLVRLSLVRRPLLARACAS